MTLPALHCCWISAAGQEGFRGAVDARFPYWSFTKTVISVCALKLVEDGTLYLDTRLSGKPYTLRQLLNHTSGLADYGQLADYHAAVAQKETPWSREKLLDLSLSQGLLFAPVQGWSYSNIGYMFVVDLIEEATGKPMRTVIDETICKPLNLKSIQLAETPAQFAQLHWDAASGYDPKWVYHGCLTGNAADAARLLHALMTGDLLRPDLMRQMLDTWSLGGALAGRPWSRHGYALGLMSGEMKNAGRAVGHSGGGPFSVNAVYHFPDLPEPITVACFTDGTDEGVAEFAAARCAVGH